MKRIPTLVTVAFPLLTLPLLYGGAQRPRLSYEPTIVELRGQLTVEQHYGPPNYGESPQTDEKVRVPVLALSAPVDVQGDPQSDVNGETVHGVKKIQLVVLPPRSYRTLIAKNVGNRVVAKGTLFHAITGHHYTEVLMDVLSVAKLADDNK